MKLKNLIEFLLENNPSFKIHVNGNLKNTDEICIDKTNTKIEKENDKYLVSMTIGNNDKMITLNKSYYKFPKLSNPKFEFNKLKNKLLSFKMQDRILL